MSLDNSTKLKEVAKLICKDFRRKSTKAEKKFWEAVRNRRFYGKKFYRQYPLFHDITGRETFFIADFYSCTEKLIIELDGHYHQYRLKEDEKRTEILSKLGLKVIRFSNDEIMSDMDGVLYTMKRFLEC